MNLSEITTEDGEPIQANREHYTLELDIPTGVFRVVDCVPRHIVGNGVYADIREGSRAANYPIVDGKVYGIWACFDKLESGLGRGET